MDIEQEVFDGDDASDLPEEFKTMSAADVERRTRLLDNEVRVLREESQRLTSEGAGLKEKIKENKEKIKLNNQLPYLVSNIVEVLDMNPEDEDEEDGAAMDVDAQRRGASAFAVPMAEIPVPGAQLCPSQAALDQSEV
jgi:26S proteasome regulatory subunit T5